MEYKFLENETFYPTPAVLLDDIMRDVKLDGVKTILEPSAGKGNIVEYFTNKERRRYDYRFETYDIDCIEIDENLRHVLKGKGFRVIHDDFLTFSTYKHYDLIIMNPPFNKGAEHLLKALDLVKDGGQVVCLLNAETLKNPYSNVRKLLSQKLIELNASIKFENEIFECEGVERYAHVEVAIIKVNVAQKKFESTVYKKLKEEAKAYEKDFEERIGKNLPAEADFIKSIVLQYEQETKLGIDIIREVWALNAIRLEEYKLNDEKPDYYESKGIELNLKGDTFNEQVQTYIRLNRHKYWGELFKNPAFIKNLTSNLQTQWYGEIDNLSNYDFTVFNIMQVKEDILQSLVQGVEETIIKLFDEFSRYSYWDNGCTNIHYYNGWKTNKAHKINKKVIFPLNGYCCYSGRLDYNYQFREKISDIIKIFDYLDGGHRPTMLNVESVLFMAEGRGQTKNIDMKYFTIDVFKKGSVHIKLTDLDLLDKFNLFVGQRRSWLPPYYGKTAYSDLSDEDKRIVSEFSGSEEEYNKIFNNPEYYQIAVAPHYLQLA